MDERLPSDRPGVSAVEMGALQAIAYSDIFDYPLTAAEVHRYLVGLPAPRESVRAALDKGLAGASLSFRSDLYMLPGREEIVDTRRRRAQTAAFQWPRAVSYGAAIARLPFVRMVAVTGALSMDNVEPDTDIDFMVVTEPDRLWICRALVVILVRLAARRGDVVCPNYFLSERALTLANRNIFTAHELVQMVPLFGLPVYLRMCMLNDWAARFLPNAFGVPRQVEYDYHSHYSLDTGNEVMPNGYPRALVESALRSPAGTWLERWEMGRKVRRFNGQAAARTYDAGADCVEGETAFSVDRCKGHFDDHDSMAVGAYRERLQRIASSLPGGAELFADLVQSGSNAA